MIINIRALRIIYKYNIWFEDIFISLVNFQLIYRTAYKNQLIKLNLK